MKNGELTTIIAEERMGFRGWNGVRCDRCGTIFTFDRTRSTFIALETITKAGWRRFCDEPEDDRCPKEECQRND